MARGEAQSYAIGNKTLKCIKGVMWETLDGYGVIGERVQIPPESRSCVDVIQLV